MAFTWSEQQEHLRTLVRRACGDGARSRTVHDGGPPGDPTLWADLHDAGLLTLGIPEDRGGAGGGILDQVVVALELGRAVSPAPFVSSTMMAGRLLAASACPHPLVAAMAGGDVVACAIEHAPQRRVDESGAKATVTGVARMVLDGPAATHLLVSAVVDARVVVGVVDPAGAGARQVDHPTLDRGRPVSTITLDAAPIDLLTEPSERDIPPGPTGGWGDAVRDALRVGAVGLAAESAGIARRCLDLSCAYALSRRQFGEVIGQFQATKHRLADMLVQTENALAAVQLGAFALAGNGDDVDLSVAAAKATATDAAVQVVGDAIQLHGGIAITWEHDLHLYLRRAKANQHLLGHPTDHRDEIAARLLAAAGKD